MTKDGLVLKHNFETFFGWRIDKNTDSFLRGINEIVIYCYYAKGFTQTETAYHLGYDSTSNLSKYLRSIKQSIEHDKGLIAAYELICENAMNGKLIFLEFAKLHKAEDTRLGALVNELLKRYYRTILSNARKAQKANVSKTNV